MLTAPDESAAPILPARTQRCARCDLEISHTASICPRCQLYVGVSEQTWRTALQDAIRYLKTQRRTW